MTKKFDDFIGAVLGENIMAATPKATPTTQGKPAPGAAPATSASNQANQQTSQQQPDAELENAFKTLMMKAGQNQDHQKAIQTLQQLLTQQQQNAAN